MRLRHRRRTHRDAQRRFGEEPALTSVGAAWFPAAARPILVVRTALILSALALPAASSAQARYEGAGATQELGCDGGTATIQGARNTIRVTGRCSALVIEGAGNRVEVDLASKGRVRISGASNVVTYRTADGSKARINVAGAGNRVSMAK